MKLYPPKYLQSKFEIHRIRNKINPHKLYINEMSYSFIIILTNSLNKANCRMSQAYNYYLERAVRSLSPTHYMRYFLSSLCSSRLFRSGLFFKIARAYLIFLSVVVDARVMICSLSLGFPLWSEFSVASCFPSGSSLYKAAVGLLADLQCSTNLSPSGQRFSPL